MKRFEMKIDVTAEPSHCTSLSATDLRMLKATLLVAKATEDKKRVAALLTVIVNQLSKEGTFTNYADSMEINGLAQVLHSIIKRPDDRVDVLLNVAEKVLNRLQAQPCD